MKKIIFYIAILFASIIFCSISYACPKNERVLIIGDSHMNMSFGDRLISLFSKDNDVISYGICGASTESVLKKSITTCGFTIKSGIQGKVTEIVREWRFDVFSIEQIIALQNPDVIVIALGTNNMFNSKTSHDSTESLIKIATKFNKKIYWVGPPKLSGYKLSLEEIINVLKLLNIKYIDSRSFNTKELDIQNPHFDHKTGKRWADWSFHGLGC